MAARRSHLVQFPRCAACADNSRSSLLERSIRLPHAAPGPRGTAQRHCRLVPTNALARRARVLQVAQRSLSSWETVRSWESGLHPASRFCGDRRAQNRRRPPEFVGLREAGLRELAESAESAAVARRSARLESKEKGRRREARGDSEAPFGISESNRHAHSPRPHFAGRRAARKGPAAQQEIRGLGD